MDNEKYSHKAFWGQDLSNVDPAEFNNTTINNAGFGQVEPYTKVFPDGMTGVTFHGCNLTNCIVPPGNIIEDPKTNRHMKEQADGEMWLVDNKLDPIEPLKPWLFDEFNLSKDPKEIKTHEALREVFSATKKFSITQTKDRKVKKEISSLAQDVEKLKTILISEGKI